MTTMREALCWELQETQSFQAWHSPGSQETYENEVEESRLGQKGRCQRRNIRKGTDFQSAMMSDIWPLGHKYIY